MYSDLYVISVKSDRMSDYLTCIQSDLKKARQEYETIKRECDIKLDKAKQEIKHLENEEEKIVKRTKGLVRCPNCGEFTGMSWGDYAHERSSGSGMGSSWDCKSREP